MKEIRKTLAVTGYHLYYTVFHPKFWTCILLVMASEYLLFRPYAEIAGDFNVDVSIGELSLVWSVPFNICIMFIGLLLIFSDLPFKNNQQIFLLTRSKKRAWCISQLLYIIVISAAVTLFALLFGIFLLTGHITFENEWDKIINSAANGRLPSGYPSVHTHNIDALRMFTPYKALIWSVLSGLLCGTAFGSIIFAINLTSGTNIGILLGGLLITFRFFGELFASYFFAWISPLEWCSVDVINIDKSSRMPTPKYAICMILAIIAVCTIAVLLRSRKKSDVL